MTWMPKGRCRPALARTLRELNLLRGGRSRRAVRGLGWCSEVIFGCFMSKKQHIKQFISITILSSLLGCATPGQDTIPDDSGSERRGTDCISRSAIRDYQVLDDSNLIVTAAARRKYHVVLGRGAVGLRSSWQIAFHSPTSQVCAGFGEIVVDDGFGPEGFRIASVRELTPEDEEELLIRFGKIEPKYKQPPRKQDVEGAEVEELD